MGNCVGQRRFRDPKVDKGKAPKTPKKDDGVETIASTTGNGQKKGTAENGNTIERSEQDNDVKDTKSATSNLDSNGDKEGKAEGSSVLADKLSTSWAVFDESGDEKLRENSHNGLAEDKPILNMDSNEKNDDISSHQPKSEVHVDVKEEKSTQRLGNGEKQDKEWLKNEDDNSRGVKAAANTGLDTIESTGNQEAKDEEQKEVKDSTEKEVEVEVDRPRDEGQVNNTKNADTKPPIDTGSSDSSNTDTGKPESINILHNVQNGRLVVMKTTKEIVPNRDEEKEETIEEKAQKRLDVLKSKMEKFASIHKYFDNIIDLGQMLFMGEVLKRKVVLEDMFISGREVSGLIATSIDDEQHPNVTVRYTTDSWESTLDEESLLFDADGDNSKIVQRFFFSLFVPFEKSIEFAVNSVGCNGEVWDNNNDINYKIDDVKEHEGTGGLIAKFTPLKQAMFKDLVCRKSVTLKSASLKDGTVTVEIATRQKCNDPPVVRYTLDDWKSSTDVTSVEIKGKDKSLNISEIQLDIPKQARMKFAIFWRHEGVEYWDNNDGMNFEIQG